MNETYLPFVYGGKWAISRLVEGRWIHLVENSYLEDEADATAILRALHIPPTLSSLDLYFPHRERLGRCPTLELLELCNILDPTNPVIRNKKEYGV